MLARFVGGDGVRAAMKQERFEVRVQLVAQETFNEVLRDLSREALSGDVPRDEDDDEEDDVGPVGPEIIKALDEGILQIVD